MAQKGKSYQVSVLDFTVPGKCKTIISKVFFSVNDANKFKEEMEEKYPKPEYTVLREFY